MSNIISVESDIKCPVKKQNKSMFTYSISKNDQSSETSYNFIEGKALLYYANKNASSDY